MLAVLLALAMVAGCCYFRGRRQRQSRERHAELLFSGSGRAVSTPHRTQSGAYPDPSGTPSAVSDAHSYSIVAYTPPASSASCGLPGCSTTYSTRPALPLPVVPKPSPSLTRDRPLLPPSSLFSRTPPLVARPASSVSPVDTPTDFPPLPLPRAAHPLRLTPSAWGSTQGTSSRRLPGSIHKRIPRF